VTPPPAADARVATPPPTSDTRMATPPPASNAGAQGSAGGVGVSATPPVIDIDPINAMPDGVDRDVVERIRLKLSKRRRIQGRPARRFLIHHRWA
jgi:hypothetical protein